jgi:hypothetical protein
MDNNKTGTLGLMDFLRSSWFLIMFVGGVVWWAARQDSSRDDMKKAETRLTALENRTTILESGIGQLQLKIDIIKEDIGLIKGAVIK